ncbi:alpha/beta hydrolase family protein [Streptomyces cinereoruber]|uniref:alpha/beta hydrolase family protein n=1 Tax=Streptomyces cinereoruber TaxID=67260 RepID=UPI003636BD5C
MTEAPKTPAGNLFLYAPREAVAAVALLVPALGVPASYYEPFCREMVRQNIAVMIGDLPGQGTSRPRAGRATKHGYHHLVSSVLPYWISEIREYAGNDTPVYLAGHSLGGQLSLLYVAETPFGVDGVILITAASPHFRGYTGLSKIAVLTLSQFAMVISTIWGYWPGHRLGFGGAQPARLMREWARLARSGRFTSDGADKDYDRILENVHTPVLSISVEGDRLAPPSAVDELCRKIASAPITRWHWTPEPGLRVDHLQWARRGGPIARYIREWMAGSWGRAQNA